MNNLERASARLPNISQRRQTGRWVEKSPPGSIETPAPPRLGCKGCAMRFGKLTPPHPPPTTRGSWWESIAIAMESSMVALNYHHQLFNAFHPHTHTHPRAHACSSMSNASFPGVPLSHCHDHATRPAQTTYGAAERQKSFTSLPSNHP